MRHKDMITMPKKAFVQEHTKLIKLLEKPTKKRLRSEAKSQQQELTYMLKKYGH